MFSINPSIPVTEVKIPNTTHESQAINQLNANLSGVLLDIKNEQIKNTQNTERIASALEQLAKNNSILVL